ncbi:MAG TPA: glycosyltransferase family 4 protein [Aromatoleum sp.]|uniref:glycosyltransferase family 4 protein n=1 Tax=Aromatoleum sp. TaxID=2307007 RepID=UPI002B47C485|nr:glycosyltransferase family 4 protein [Aromatoleum sp.]HJV25437.1 glycosyltransferase family 4 protein [Aromatoleum sp.]
MPAPIDQAAPLDVLMVSTSYPSTLTDWRGLFIRHLSDALARRDDLALQLWAPPGESHPAVRPAATSAESAWLDGLMQKGGIAHLLRNSAPQGVAHALRLLQFLRSTYVRSRKVDVYHINWLQNALPLPSNGRPALITVLGTDMQLLKLPMMTTLLRRAMRGRAGAICPNAEWMVPELTEKFGDLATIRFLPFGIDPGWFAIERSLAPTGPAKWLAVTRLTRGKLGPLFEWCEPHFRDGTRELHLFGPMQEEIELPAWVHYHGPASPAELMRDWFPGAHGLITLSRHAEGRPQVMLEAMAAGLPIIASRLPAHENIVFHHETGWLCDTPQDVAAALETLEQSEANQQAGETARQWAAREIGTWDDCATRYITLYRSLLQDSRA